MNELILQDSGALTISDSDRIRIAAAWKALSVNSRRSYQGAFVAGWLGSVVGSGECVVGGDASGRSMEGFTDAVPLCERRNRSK